MSGFGNMLPLVPVREQVDALRGSRPTKNDDERAIRQEIADGALPPQLFIDPST